MCSLCLFPFLSRVTLDDNTHLFRQEAFSNFAPFLFLLEHLLSHGHFSGCGVRLQMDLGDLAILNPEDKSLATSASKDGSGSIKAHLQSLCKLGGWVGNE